MKSLFKMNTFWMALFTAIITLFQIWDNSFGTVNMNRTIGWGGGSLIDMEELNFVKYANMMGIISHNSLPIFAIGYAALFIDKRDTKTLFLVLYLFVISLTMLTPSYFFDLFLLLVILSWGVFILSVIKSKKIESP